MGTEENEESEPTEFASSAIGGAANAGGESFRADLAARIAVHMLAQSPLWNHGAVDAVPVSVRCEAAEHVDDVAVDTRMGRLLFQAKGDDRLSLPPDARRVRRDGAFVKAIAQLVAQQGQGASSPLDETTDRFVLAYKEGTEEIRRLKSIAERIAPPTKIDPNEARARLSVFRSERDKAVFERFERVLERVMHQTPTWQEAITLLRLSMFWAISEGISHRIDVDPAYHLRNVLAEGESAEAAIDVLSREFISLAAGAAAGITADGLRTFLGRRFQLQGTPNCALDIQRVSNGTRIFVENMRKAQRPAFGAIVVRDALQEVWEKLERGPTAVIGERGVGKSNLLLTMFDDLTRRAQQVVVCDLRQATPLHLLTSSTATPLHNSLSAVMGSLPRPGPTYVLIDGLEETARDRNLEKVLASLLTILCADHSLWRVCATSRDSTLRGRKWRHFFSEGIATPDSTPSTRQVRLERFTAAELSQALERGPTELVEEAARDPVISRLLSLPENLSLLAELPSSSQTSARFTKALLDVYWEQRIATPERQALVMRIAREQRNLGSGAVPLDLLTGFGSALSDLQDDGVVVVSNGRAAFAHDQLAEYVQSEIFDE